MKKIVVILLTLLAHTSYSQLIEGDIVTVNRKLLTKTDFQIKGAKAGEIFLDIAVDIYGNVTSANVIHHLTTINSSPIKMEAKKLALTYKFEEGTMYPKHHHAKLKITVVVEQ